MISEADIYRSAQVMIREHGKAALELSRARANAFWDAGADKAAAIASYARQSDDKTLENMAARIRARVIRRTGELLEEFQGSVRAN